MGIGWQMTPPEIGLSLEIVTDGLFLFRTFGESFTSQATGQTEAIEIAHEL
jgi:hypothetical protein